MNIVLFLEIKVHIKIINIPTNRNIYNKFGAVQIRVMPSSLGPFFVHSEPKWITDDNKPSAH